MDSTEQYRVWFPQLAEDEDDCRLVMAYDHDEAAKIAVGAIYKQEPFDHGLLAMVRCTFGGDEGELKAFDVHPECVTNFYAYQVNP